MEKAQVIHKCGDDESQGLFHVIRMCCLRWDSQLDLAYVSNGEGREDTPGARKLQMPQLVTGKSVGEWKAVGSWRRKA